jgi:GNAT superfamily N-acetyltransferase
MSKLADDLVRFWEALDSGLERRERAWWGTVVTDRRFPAVWDTNYARIETADPAVSLEDVGPVLDPALEAAGAAAFHVVMFRPRVTERLRSDLTARGDRLSWDIVMVHRDAPPSIGSTGVEELAVDEDHWTRVAATLPSFGVTEAETARQLVRIDREVLDPSGAKRWFGVRDATGDVVSVGALVLLDGIGYVDHVVTFPQARGRGHALSVVTRIVHEARAAGADPLFLLVDPEGPVALYERLGFREGTRIASTLSTRQLGGGGR